jgi:hypothetical protein
VAATVGLRSDGEIARPLNSSLREKIGQLCCPLLGCCGCARLKRRDVGLLAQMLHREDSSEPEDEALCNGT